MVVLIFVVITVKIVPIVVVSIYQNKRKINIEMNYLNYTPLLVNESVIFVVSVCLGKRTASGTTITVITKILITTTKITHRIFL